MRKIGWMLGVVMLAMVGSAAAQPAPGSCPADVGQALAEACPCDGPQPWKNHGKYVSCVVRLRNELRKAGCLDDAAKREISRCAARSTCGKAGAVLCCSWDTSGVCDDPVEDGTAAGTCSNDAAVACDTSLDCVKASAAKVSRSEDACTAAGGTSIGGGSVCGGCPALPPAP